MKKLFYPILTIVFFSIAMILWVFYLNLGNSHEKEMTTVAEYFCCEVLEMSNCRYEFGENNTHFWFQCGTPMGADSEGQMRLRTLTKAWEK